uniref:Uncharacterized protein n=1 Tax=Oryza punctata TaxID=4537 RepID=A0A0E0K8K0_ORYPU
MLIDKLGKQQIIARNSVSGRRWLLVSEEVNHRDARGFAVPPSACAGFAFLPIPISNPPHLSSSSPTNSAPNPPLPISKISSRWPGPHAHHLLLNRSGNSPGALSALRQIRLVSSLPQLCFFSGGFSLAPSVD